MSLTELEAYAAPISKEMQRIHRLTSRITMSLLGQEFKLRIMPDLRHTDCGRIFLQIVYSSPCTKTEKMEEWRGRKWYLSEFMTDDEIVKTAWAAFEAAVKHEVLEGFKVDGKVLFNPHVNFEELLTVTHKEVTRYDASNTNRETKTGGAGTIHAPLPSPI